jgi:outer membrane lipoprotein-sorting protein
MERHEVHKEMRRIRNLAVAAAAISIVAILTPAAAQSQSPADLEKVLTQLDAASARFKSAEADFRWDQYQKVVNETDVQSGKVYFQRQDHGTLMAADINEPEKKILLFNGGKLRFYQPRIEQVTEYEAGKNRDEVESFLVLGFGSRGHDLLDKFDVKYTGQEVIGGVPTVRLELTPKSPKVRNMFDRIILWIDPVRDVSLKQQAFEPSGDYRIATYSNFKMNSKLPDDTFKLKTTGRTKVVHP